MENGGRISWEKKSSISINAEKNNLPNYIERFKVPTVLMIMFNMHWNILLIRATWFMNDEILILLSFCVFK
jgi:hypothetical protein